MREASLRKFPMDEQMLTIEVRTRRLDDPQMTSDDL
jgi:hypothetical protein